MKARKGDLINLALSDEFDIIIHGCNCFNTMGAGIAKSIRHVFPHAYKADCKTESGSSDKLGTYTYSLERTATGKKLYVINAYTQFEYGGYKDLVEYESLREVFAKIRTDFLVMNPDLRVGYPKIGAGKANGNWEVISLIIDNELEGYDHTLVELA